MAADDERITKKLSSSWPSSRSESPPRVRRSSAGEADQILKVFHKIDRTGFITREKLSKILQALSPESWEPGDVDKLLRAAKLNCDPVGRFDCPAFISWVIGGNNGDLAEPHTEPTPRDGRGLGGTASATAAARSKKPGGRHGLRILASHSASVTSAQFSPRGSRVLTASADGTAKLFRADVGECLAIFEGHNAGVTTASFSPDGRWVVTSSTDRTARIFDASNGMCMHILRHAGSVLCAAFSFNGQKVVTTSADGSAAVFDAETGVRQQIVEGLGDAVDSAAFSPDGRQVLLRMAGGDVAMFEVQSPGDDAVDAKPQAAWGKHVGQLNRGISFSEEADDVLDAASEATPNGSKRDLKHRVNTGYVKAPTLETKASLTFSDAGDEILDAASEASPSGSRRELRERVSTGFSVGLRLRARPSVAFSEEGDAVVDAASEASPTSSKRNVMYRVCTGFVRNDSTEVQPSVSVSFSERSEVLDAASEATPAGPRRNLRQRVNTGFEREAKSLHAVSFCEQGDDELDAASEATPSGSARKLIQKVCTGFIHDSSLEPEPRVGFSDHGDEVVDAASQASPTGSTRSLRSRVGTGFVREAKVADRPSISFSEGDEVLDAASEATPNGSRRSLRQRVATGFARELAVESKPSVCFSGGGDDVLDAASEATPNGSKRTVRERVQTGFVRDATAVKQPSVSFSEEGDDVVDAASPATPPGTQRNLRERVATGFSREFLPADKSSVTFANTGNAAVNRSGGLSSGTASATQKKKHMGQRALQFVGPDVGLGEGATPASSSSSRAVMDQRTGCKTDNSEVSTRTGSRDRSPPRSRSRGVAGVILGKTAAAGKRVQVSQQAAEVLDAASTATTGPKRNIRTRVNTGFAHSPEKAEMDESKGVNFSHEEPEVLDAASAATDGPKRSLRTRVSTGFETGKADEDGVKEVLISVDAPEVLEAASAACDGPKRSLRTRVSTGFAQEAEAQPDNDEQKVHIASEAVEVLEAASVAAEGNRRSVRTRVSTGYIKDKDADGQKSGNVQFTGEAPDVLDAASEAPAGRARRSLRQRINTGFVQSADTNDSVEGTPRDEQPVLHHRPKRRNSSVEFASRADVLPQKVEDTNVPQRSVRQRISTGYIWGDIMLGAEGADVLNQDEEEEEADDSTILMLHGKRTSVRMSLTANQVKKLSLLQSKGMLVGGRASFDCTTSDDGSRTARSEDVVQTDFCQQVSTSSDDQHQRVRGSKEKRPTELAIRLHRDDEDRKPVDSTSPECSLHDRVVKDFEKDCDLLMQSLRPLIFFEDLDENNLRALAEALEVYEFADGEDVVRQGDTDGTHFFIVADGNFAVITDGNVVATLEPGTAFGESVLLIDGERTATVRALGKSRVYGMEGETVRDVLQLHYEVTHLEAVNCMSQVIDAKACVALSGLNTFQIATLEEEATVKSFCHGEAIFEEGAESCMQVYLLVSGSVVLRSQGQDIKRIKRNTMFGERGFVLGAAPVSAVVDGAAKVVVLGFAVLEAVFGADLHRVLMQNLVHAQLSELRAISHLHEDQLHSLARTFHLVAMEPGEALDTIDVRFLMAEGGEIEITDEQGTRVKGGISWCVGVKHLLNPKLPWNIGVRAIGSGTKVCVWYRQDVDQNADLDDKLRILKTVFLFRTLPRVQIMKLAKSMRLEQLTVGSTVFQQGDKGENFYIVKRGRLQIEKDGRFIRGLGAGDYFGDRALINSEPRSASISAADDCELWSIDQEIFRQSMSPQALEYLKTRAVLQDTEFSFSDLQGIRVIGRGGFGVVKMVRSKTGDRFALKRVQKKELVKRGIQDSVIAERHILSELDHPFIIKLVQTFRTTAFVYFLTELITGGELLHALETLGLLTFSQAQFYTGCLVLALEHLHDRRIAYLDLKGENVLIDNQGYIKLIDFGIATKITGGQSYMVKGTPHFMSPEMILSKGYGTSADLWSLGILIYDFSVGRLPFGTDTSSNSQIFKAILKSPLEFPAWFREKEDSAVLIEIVTDLLSKEPSSRPGAGYRGYEALREHNFFRGFSFDDLLGRQVDPPFIPRTERFAEDREQQAEAQGDVSGSPRRRKGKSLAVDEEVDEKKELEDGWQDPDPGWDDDFCS